MQKNNNNKTLKRWRNHELLINILGFFKVERFAQISTPICKAKPFTCRGCNVAHKTRSCQLVCFQICGLNYFFSELENLQSRLFFHTFVFVTRKELMAIFKNISLFCMACYLLTAGSKGALLYWDTTARLNHSRMSSCWGQKACGKTAAARRVQVLSRTTVNTEVSASI